MAALANIRLYERERLRDLLREGCIVQVSGPPMVGKLTTVKQVLSDMRTVSHMQGSLCSTPHAGPFMFHHFSCKAARTRADVLNRMASKLFGVAHRLDDLPLLESLVLPCLKDAVERTASCHHVLVFEKCESLVTHDADSCFLGFLCELRQTLTPHRVTIVFTSYKRFEWCGGVQSLWQPARDRMVIGPVLDCEGNTCYTLEIGQLMDTDILCALQHFAPNVDASPYLQVFQRFLGFPEAVRKVAQTFLVCSDGSSGGGGGGGGSGGSGSVGGGGGGRVGWDSHGCASGRAAGGSMVLVSADTLERRIKTDIGFLQAVFGPRLDEVVDWVGWESLLVLRHLGSSMDSSATRECFQSVAAGESDSYRWAQLSRLLERFYVIRELPGVQRFVVHPLVIYFCQTQLKAMEVALRGQETDLFCNRFTHFLCATLSSLDACSTLKGRQLEVVSTMLYECPNIRHVISMALLASESSYRVYFKLAVSGAGMLAYLCPREIVSFYACLYERSKVQPLPNIIEQAVILGLYGQALANGRTGTSPSALSSPGTRSQEAVEHLTRAIDLLSMPDIPPSYYLLLFLMEKAKTLNRQGKYDQSLSCFKKARSLFPRIKTHALGEDFAVTEAKLRETCLIVSLYETVPMIFKGKNAEAQERLLLLETRMGQEFPSSVELPTIYNQLGLAEQRDKKNLQKAKEWYLKCFNLRMYFLKINALPLYAPLNNVAMICYGDKDFRQFYRLLEKALAISKEFEWLNYYTGLSLVHLAEGSIGLGHFQSAMQYLKEGERVLSHTSKDHDLRLRAILELAHVRAALNHREESKMTHAPASRIRDHEASLMPHAQVANTLQFQPQPLICCPHQVPMAGENIPLDGYLVPSAVGKCRPISPADMAKSPRDHLNCLTHVIKEMKGTLSDDGHNIVFSAYEHALLLNWESPLTFRDFRDKIFEHVTQHKFIEPLFHQERPNRYHNLHKHRHVYFYIKECAEMGRDLDLRTFLRLQVPACTTCQYGRDFFTEDMWCREVNSMVRSQRALGNFMASPSSSPPPTLDSSDRPVAISAGSLVNNSLDSLPYLFRESVDFARQAESSCCSNTSAFPHTSTRPNGMMNGLVGCRTEPSHPATVGNPHNVARPFPCFRGTQVQSDVGLAACHDVCTLPKFNNLTPTSDFSSLEGVQPLLRPLELEHEGPNNVNCPDMYVFQTISQGSFGKLSDALEERLTPQVRIRDSEVSDVDNWNVAKTFCDQAASFKVSDASKVTNIQGYNRNCMRLGQNHDALPQRRREPRENLEPLDCSLPQMIAPVDPSVRQPVEVEEDSQVFGGTTVDLGRGLAVWENDVAIHKAPVLDRPRPKPVEDSWPQSPQQAHFPVQAVDHRPLRIHDGDFPNNLQAEAGHDILMLERTLMDKSCAPPGHVNSVDFQEHEKSIQFCVKDKKLTQGVQQLADLGELDFGSPALDQTSSTIGSSGLGSSRRSDPDGLPSIPGNILPQPHCGMSVQQNVVGPYSAPCQNGGARPKIFERAVKKKRNNSNND